MNFLMNLLTPLELARRADLANPSQPWQLLRMQQPSTPDAKYRQQDAEAAARQRAKQLDNVLASQHGLLAMQAQDNRSSQA